ncbi:MAG: hypothetical protein OJF62_002779 [Pseudolabrys sp.]|jgi:integrase|nr:hypothetical protein [Pseudolabrys sp.]
MRVSMGLIKHPVHGTYYERRKVPERLQAAVAQVLEQGKAKQVWLKRSLGTKDLRAAKVRAAPVRIEFDGIIERAEALLKARPVRKHLSDTEIKRIADYFYAHELAADQELREDTRGSDPLFASVQRQLKEAGVEVSSPFDASPLSLEPGAGLSTRTLHQIEEDASIVLPAARQALARGDVSFLSYEVNELLEVFQINLDPSTADYRKLSRVVLEAYVRALQVTQERNRGAPHVTPPLIEPTAPVANAGGTLGEALEGWRKERSPSLGVLREYERAVRLFAEVHGNVPVAQITRTHARVFREKLQLLPRHRAEALRDASLPDLAEWAEKHPSAPRITNATVSKLLGGVQTIALWAFENGMVPDEVRWSDPFARMRLKKDEPEREAFTTDDLNKLFRAGVFTKGERPKPGAGEAAFWMPLIALYTGARRAEIAALTAADVHKIDDVWVFSFVEERDIGKKLKTRASARTVPMHPTLIGLGLVRYVDRVKCSGDERSWLFPLVSPQVPERLKAWSKWFHRYLRSAGITDTRKVFHSFRHTFKDALRAVRTPEDLNDALTGHSNATVGRGYPPLLEASLR